MTGRLFWQGSLLLLKPRENKSFQHDNTTDAQFVDEAGLF